MKQEMKQDSLLNVSSIKAEPDPLLLIGGTDPSGAGLQVDWQVASALNIDANSIVTAVTAQNATTVSDMGVLPSEQFKAQLDAINPEQFSILKVGMLGDETIINVLVDFLRESSNGVAKKTLILDPVLMASSGGKLLTDKGVELLLSSFITVDNFNHPKS